MNLLPLPLLFARWLFCVPFCRGDCFRSCFGVYCCCRRLPRAPFFFFGRRIVQFVPVGCCGSRESRKTFLPLPLLFARCFFCVPSCRGDFFRSCSDVSRCGRRLPRLPRSFFSGALSNSYVYGHVDVQAKLHVYVYVHVYVYTYVYVYVCLHVYVYAEVYVNAYGLCKWVSYPGLRRDANPGTKPWYESFITATRTA